MISLIPRSTVDPPSVIASFVRRKLWRIFVRAKGEFVFLGSLFGSVGWPIGISISWLGSICISVTKAKSRRLSNSSVWRARACVLPFWIQVLPWWVATFIWWAVFIRTFTSIMYTRLLKAFSHFSGAIKFKQISAVLYCLCAHGMAHTWSAVLRIHEVKILNVL